MYKPSVDDMLAGKQSRYSLVIAVAKRARQLAEKDQRKKIISTEKYVLKAVKDFENHKYDILEPEIND